MPKARTIYAVEAIRTEPRGDGKSEREIGRRMVTPALVARARADTTARVDGLLAALAARGVLSPGAPDAATVVERFETVYAERPLRDNAGGTMRNSSTWLFAVAAVLRPSTIVESGTFKGHGSWLMAQAAPDARIVTFDVVRETGRVTAPGVDYRLGDWSDAADLRKLPPDTLCVFDDHISHRQRLSEARDRGARLALVDDDYPATALYATGSPPVPTVAMLTDPLLNPGTECMWERPGKRYRYTFSDSDQAMAHATIAWIEPMPDLSRLNHYVPQAPMTLVGLR